MKKMIITSISVLSLISCNDKNDAPVSFENRVPEKLAFSAPAKGEMPSDAQLKEISQTFQNQNKMMLPPGDLVFPSDLSSNEIAKKEKQLKAEDLNSYNLLKEIQANCSAPKPVMNSNLPKEGQKVEPKAGDIYSMDLNFNLTAKSGSCPMTSKGEMGMKVVFEKMDRNETKVTNMGVSAGANGKLEFLIQKPEYQKLLNARGMIVDTNMSGLYSLVEPNQKMYMTANLNGSYITLQKQVDYTTTFEMVNRGSVNGSMSKSQIIARAELKFPSFKVSIVTHSISEGERTLLSEVYLNGNKLDSNQQQKLLNREVPGIGVVDQSRLLNALK